MKRLFILLCLVFSSGNTFSFVDPFDENSCRQLEVEEENRCTSEFFPLNFLDELSGLSEFIDVDDERQDLAALSTQLKVYHFHRAQLAIQDHLVLLKGLGAGKDQMLDALKTSGNPCEDDAFENIRSTLNDQALVMATELDKQPTTEEDQKNFF